MTDSIFIPGNVPSSKNSKVWTGRYLVNSKSVKKYLKFAEGHYLYQTTYFERLSSGKEFPLHVEFKFVRDSKRLFDLINAAQIVQDLMVKYEYIPDDNYRYLIPHFDPEVVIDKKNCGVYITVL